MIARRPNSTTALLAGVFVLSICFEGFGADATANERPDESWSVERLMSAMGGEIPQHRLAAANAVAKKGAEVVPKLIEILGHEDWRMRRSAEDALAAIGPEAKDAVTSLVEALEDKDPWIRDGAAEALGKIGEEAKAACPALTKAVADKDIWVRESAMVALNSITKDKQILLSAAAAMIRVPSTGFSDHRHAIEILKRHGRDYEPAIPGLISMIENPGEGMWSGALMTAMDLAAGFGEDAKGAIPGIGEFLKHRNAGWRSAAAAALGKFGKTAASALPKLRELSEKDKEEKVREAAKKAVDQIESRTRG